MNGPLIDCLTHGDKQRSICYYPLARREAPAEGRRPEGANIDRRLVLYHAKYKRIQSRIEFIYLYICINRGSHARHRNFGHGK